MAYYDSKEAEREISRATSSYEQKKAEYEAERHGYSVDYTGGKASLEKDYGSSLSNSSNSSSSWSNGSTSSNGGSYQMDTGDTIDSIELGAFFQLIKVVFILQLAFLGAAFTVLLPIIMILYEKDGILPDSSALTEEHPFLLMGIIGFVTLLIFASFGRLIIAYLNLIAVFAYYIYFEIPIWTDPITMILLALPILLFFFSNWNYYLKSFLFVVVPAVSIYLLDSEHYAWWTAMFLAGLLLLCRRPNQSK